MSTLNNTTASENISVVPMIRIPHYIRFWYFLIFDILSLICTLFALYFFLCDRTLRRSLYNHVIIILLGINLLYELTDIPFHIHNDQHDVPWLASSTFYLFWVFIDYSIYSLQIALFAWASIERHILIFHDQWVFTRKKRLFIHYLPMITIIVYYTIYYSMVYFGIPCSYSFDEYLSGGIYIPCAFNRTFLATWDLMVHQVIPTLLIMIFCIALLIRVTRQRVRMRRSINWGKQRKMTIQLLTISSIYMVFNTPWIVVIFAYQCGLPLSIAIYGIIYGKFLIYNIIFFFPFMCLLSLPDLRIKIRENILHCGRQRGIVPLAINTGNRARTQPNGG